MGHVGGVVTISVAEADAVLRTTRKEALDEFPLVDALLVHRSQRKRTQAGKHGGCPFRNLIDRN